MPRIHLALTCLAIAATVAPGQTLTVMSPAQVTVSKRLSQGNDQGQGKGRDHKKLPPVDGASSTGQPDGALQTQLGPLIAATSGSNFEGVGASGFAPSDANMAVGQNPSFNYILQTVNSRYAIFTKSGAIVVGPNSLSSLWSPLGNSNGCATKNAGDVVAQYDKLADRWIITQLGGTSPPFSECIAISQTADPTGVYYLYSFDYGTTLNDYPKFGVWPTSSNGAYVASFNLFGNNGNTFTGGQLCAYDRTKMLVGDPSAQAICFTLNGDGGYLPADLDGSTLPLNGTPALFMNFPSSSSLRMYALAPNFASPNTSTLTHVGSDLPVTPFSEACGGGACVPQSGTNVQLDSLGDRLMYRLAFRNFGDHEALVVNHSVTSGASVGERWYELRAPVSTTPSFSVFQQGTYAPDATFRWMGSAAMDAAGDIALGYSASSGSIRPAIRYTGRVPSDPLGTMESEASIIEGTGSQTGGLDRWGDYSSMRIDPADDCTFWYTNQYLANNGSYNWRTRIGSFKFTSCGAQVATPTFTPPAGSYGSAQPVTISTSTAGASIRYTTDGSTPSSTVGTVYAGPVLVSSSLTLKAIAYKSGLTDSLVATAAYIIGGGVSNTAAFVKTDTATQGTWKGVYGAHGYNVINDTISYPGYVTVTPAGQSSYTWAGSTSDVRAMQKALSSTDRLAATWYTASSFTVDLNFNDGLQHQLAVYCLDWDPAGRLQTLSILDGATNAVLNSQNVTSFQNGKYLVWNLTGHVILKVTNTGPGNGVISGLFFDPPSGVSTVAMPTFTPPAGSYGSAQLVTISTTTLGASIRYTTDGSTPTSSVGTLYNNTPVSVSGSLTLKAIAYKSGLTDSLVATAAYIIGGGASNTAAFVKTDTATQGTWKGVYGSNGYNVINDTISYPGYVTVTPASQSSYTWTGSTSDVRALQKALSSTDRIAATWYTSTSFTVDLNFTDGLQHQLAVYCLDWDPAGRLQTLSILDGATNAVLNSQNVANFQNGKYLVWNLTGHVILKVTNTGPGNGVISGLFFDPPAGGASGNTAAFVKTDAATQGTWKGVYGTGGYNVINDTISYPGYATVTPTSQSSYTWTGSTTDVRALQKAPSSTDRIAATWYTSTSFSVDLNFNDGLHHQLAVYCLDWDLAGRLQTLSILDGATNAVLNSQNATSFQNGKYLVWNLTGHVILKVTNTGSTNATISGLFFD